MNDICANTIQKVLIVRYHKQCLFPVLKVAENKINRSPIYNTICLFDKHSGKCMFKTLQCQLKTPINHNARNDLKMFKTLQ